MTLVHLEEYTVNNNKIPLFGDIKLNSTIYLTKHT